ncbi:hypothetical protein [Cytophaga hutchinsonii]|jgi:hypothetical protein|uniref:DUF304 domain-containing protein n=1 Tax=Cytophaga hutchinsonii (strain ATCC 33406 / DSM 1761 / CIP 103989 / NBRC 15051 / NCIMB 9469 / D465) TaxID=269798 RepID=A0A6N4SWL2_CYTH3|nr:hypothetical protein [Cytophaga hutchinsonii]ABG60698.1 hypothetical protein CHU_3464 [Cytophaga hutchinsonii ATCC 33406]SFX69867.1 hypothetical protein SAMN04487930_10823 [Cytophaga hutchinsonii ATCC 33406]
MKYVSSRLSSGNNVFPTEIHIEPSGISIKEPGVFKSKSTFISFVDIVSVSIDNPLIGYSTLTFFTNSTAVSVTGFTKKQSEEINALIKAKK